MCGASLPSPAIVQIQELALDALERKWRGARHMCLHARLERDWLLDACQWKGKGEGILTTRQHRAGLCPNGRRPRGGWHGYLTAPEMGKSLWIRRAQMQQENPGTSYGSVVYVATGNADLILRLREMFNVIVREDLIDLRSAMGTTLAGLELSYVAALVDQAVCSRAVAFAGSKYSSYSQALRALVSAQGGAYIQLDDDPLEEDIRQREGYQGERRRPSKESGRGNGEPKGKDFQSIRRHRDNRFQRQTHVRASQRLASTWEANRPWFKRG
mmetsp:Transcript_56118/g.177819  ORF Transcript_56118/g.177819 Transcript_56118/m.177819 type:complete len:271 (-) Transcript_56118:591-1403(-)